MLNKPLVVICSFNQNLMSICLVPVTEHTWQLVRTFLPSESMQCELTVIRCGGCSGFSRMLWCLQGWQGRWGVSNRMIIGLGLLGGSSSFLLLQIS